MQYPYEYTDCPTLILIRIISEVLNKICNLNNALGGSRITRFHSRAPPSISIGDYLERIVKYASLETSCLVMILVFIDRMCEKNRHFSVSSLTVHRFLITACTVAAKSLCDSYCTNTHYAKVGGISMQELNMLELEFLFMIDWDLGITREGLQKYYMNLVLQHPDNTLVERV
ncbi:Cyclin PHO80-like domain-containing protein [Rozella allomycis CSF55]|uniref:Cyclin n=1 Tax=Rozella allomycis (strain CSF55) TaxID=988480 RepID=A0A075AP82_ROZAC|nr:Cyclin PHO80-like domain-containing protein [Rozella allomycis CSF55]|eukprot:EPZ31854.1 Cyclin PHO80-like domain-containing protein [Rozella allomycis CSF55]